ncbi:glycosyltransferase [Shewanella algae]|uniref:glycosyltransferase n=1 Tax=Shewanella algae TaxID=38313 RepID=UPI001183345E|nr:glycosyltransferase [Shewanella algae]TVP08401.1 hypothetical protein AYI73_00620 [Shewanella algae]BCV40210.1 glycosyl transferase [Shewanella algae]
MRVLHVINSLGVGGAEKMLLDIVVCMRRKLSFSVDVLVLADVDISLKNEFLNAGVNVISLNKPTRYSLSNLLPIIKIVSNYDVIHSHLFPSNYWIAIASLFVRKPRFVTTEHSTHNRRREHFAFKILDRAVYSRYQAIIAISDDTKARLLSWIGHTDKINVIYNAVNLDVYSDSSDEVSSNTEYSKKFTIIMVSNFSKQKDHETVIRAMKHLPKDINLLFVGDGERKEHIISLAKDLHLNDQITFLGTRKDVPALIKNSDLVVVSSHWEGFGLVAVEGMASKKPVVASDVDGLRQVVEGAGLLFRKGDDIDLASKISSLYQNRQLYDNVCEKCHMRSKDFSIEKLVEKYVEVYRN